MPTSGNQVAINVPGNSASGNNEPNKYNKIINVIQLHFITCIYKTNLISKVKMWTNLNSYKTPKIENSPIEVDIEVLESHPLGNNVNLL